MPPQGTVDEVTTGYNAYSILKTGADEYGTKFPVLLRAYDDWRPALYVYLVIPFVKLFGLTVIAVRLPAVILSVFTVVAVYFLTKELTRGARAIKFGHFDLDIPLITMAFFAISPWDIYISRLGHEVNASFSFLIFGILFLLKFVNGESVRKNINLYLGAVFMGLSFDSYQSTKVVVPLIAIVLFALFFKKFLSDKKALIISLLLGFIVILPILATSLDANALIRFKGTSLLSNSEDYFTKVNNRLNSERASGDALGKVFDNDKTSSLLLISHAYLSHLSPVWLFINEGAEQFKAPTIGLLYLFEIPLIFIGILFLVKSGIQNKMIVFILCWGIIAILPGAITTGYAHPMRIFSILPIPDIFAAIGFIVICEAISKKAYRSFFLGFSVIVYIIFSLWFFHSYFVLAPKELYPQFQYGVLNALASASKVDDKYSNVVVSNSGQFFESYMFYLYLHKYDPSIYQLAGGTGSGGYAEVHQIGKYFFGDVISRLGQKDTLYVLSAEDYISHKKGLKRIDRIYGPDGKIIFYIAKTK